jgi:cytochrome c-type biogenesis protein CcmH/NrfF
MIVLLAVLGTATNARAQHVESGMTVPVIARSPLEKAMQRKLICMCRTCGRESLAECTCSKAVEMRAELAKLVADGKSEQQIVDHYIAEYGSEEPLASPIDRGFNRLAWAVPYVLGSAGLLFVGVVAVRWTRRHPDAAADAPTAKVTEPADTALESRLDDELRDLD